MSTRRNWASGYLGKVVAALCSLMLAVAFFPAASISAWAEESAAATAAFSIKVYNEYTDKTEAVQSFTQDELNALAEQNTDELTYMYTGKSGDTTVTTKSYVTFAQLLDGVDSWVAGATLNPSDRNKGNPWTYEEITAELKCQDKAAPAVLALAAEKNGTAIESTDAPMTCMGTEDGSNAAGNCFWTGTSDFVVTTGFNIYAKSAINGATNLKKTYAKSALAKLAEKNTNELTYKFTGKSGDTTVTTKSYVTFAQLLEGVDEWAAGTTVNPSDRGKGDPWTYEFITAELKCQDASAPAVLALEAAKNEVAIDNAPMTCMGTEDGSNAAGNCFWTSTSDLVVTYDPGFPITVKNAFTGVSTEAKSYTLAQLQDMAAKNTNELTYKFTGKSGDTTVTTKSYVTFAQLLEGVSEWTAGSTVNPSDRGKGDPWTYEFITAELKCQGASAPAVLALEAAKDEVAIDNAPMTCMGTEDGTNAAGNCFWTSTSDLVVTYLQPLDTATVTVAKAKAYTGKAQTPAVTAKLGDTALVEGTDYTLAYAKNTNAGTATATITGMGNCTGTATATFTIAKAANTLKVNAVKKVQNAKAKKKTSLKANKVFKVAKNVSKGALTYTKASGNKNISVAKNGKVTVKKGLKKGKSYTVKVKVASKATTNYKAANTTVSFKVKVK